MSKNLTRKGLAFGALVALTSSVIAGAPAVAADSVVLEPTLGTSYNTILGEDFKLTSLFTAAAQQGAETQKFRIVDTEKKLDITNGTDLDNAYNGTYSADVTGNDTDATVNRTAADGIYILEGGSAVGPAKDVLRLVSAGATSTFSVTVQSWLDFDGDNVIDTGEAASTVRTVKFVKASEVVSTTTITAPMVGDTTLTATLEFNDINNEQLPAATVGLLFRKGNDTGLASGPADTNFIDTNGITWSATDKFKYVSTGALATAFAAGDIVLAKALYKSVGTPAAADTIGSTVYATVAKRTVTTVTSDIVRSVNAKTDATNVGTNSASQEVNRNKEFEFKITAKDDSVTPKGVAGLAVKISVYASNWSSISSSPTSANPVSLGSGSTDKKITVNGTTYTDTTKLPGYSTTVATIAATTDADGVAKVKIQTANFVVGDHVSAKFVVENFTKYVSARSVDPSYSAHIANASTGVGTTDGVAAAVNVVVVDQFGGAPADGTYDARAVWSSNGQATAASTAASSTTKAVVGGKATLSILDNGTGVGTNVYAIKASKLADGGGYASDIAIDDLEVNIKAASDLVPGKITSTGIYDSDTKVYANAGPTSLNLNDAKTYDSRLVLGDAPTVGNSIALSGVVSTSNLTPIEGAALTIAGSGLQFIKNGATIYGKDSLTVYTDASGNWAIDVASNKAGKQTLTLTSGSVSQVVTVTFKAAGADTGAALTLDAPANVLPGRTLTLTATLADKYGNGVDTDANVSSGSSVSRTVSVAWSGPGLISGTLPTAFDADGKLTVKVLLGATETGSGVFTVKYDRNNDGDYDDTASTVASPDITKTATVTVGAAPVVVAPTKANVVAKTKAFSVSVSGNASAKNVVVKVAGKTVATLKGSASAKTYTVKATKGSKKVTVYVGGKLIATKTVSVK
jgi:hypothetical protein